MDLEFPLLVRCSSPGWAAAHVQPLFLSESSAAALHGHGSVLGSPLISKFLPSLRAAASQVFTSPPIEPLAEITEV